MSFLLQPLHMLFSPTYDHFHTDGKPLYLVQNMLCADSHYNAVELIQAPVSHVPFAFIGMFSL